MHDVVAWYFDYVHILNGWSFRQWFPDEFSLWNFVSARRRGYQELFLAASMAVLYRTTIKVQNRSTVDDKCFLVEMQVTHNKTADARILNNTYCSTESWIYSYSCMLFMYWSLISENSTVLLYSTKGSNKLCELIERNGDELADIRKHCVSTSCICSYSTVDL